MSMIWSFPATSRGEHTGPWTGNGDVAQSANIPVELIRHFPDPYQPTSGERLFASNLIPPSLCINDLRPSSVGHGTDPTESLTR